MGIVFSVIAVASFGLTAIGFAPAGITGGSIAASIQSSIGNVVAGSTFASLQSLGATGTLLEMGTIGAGMAVAGAALGGELAHSPEEELGIGNDSLDSLKTTNAHNRFSLEPAAKMKKCTRF